MRKPENSVIPCFTKIDVNGILTVGNWTSETRKFRGNLTEILTEMFNGNGTVLEIAGKKTAYHNGPQTSTPDVD